MSGIFIIQGASLHWSIPVSLCSVMHTCSLLNLWVRVLLHVKKKRKRGRIYVNAF
jgi:hypothetical protein